MSTPSHDALREKVIESTARVLKGHGKKVTRAELEEAFNDVLKEKVRQGWRCAANCPACMSVPVVIKMPEEPTR